MFRNPYAENDFAYTGTYDTTLRRWIIQCNKSIIFIHAKRVLRARLRQVYGRYGSSGKEF